MFVSHCRAPYCMSIHIDHIIIVLTFRSIVLYEQVIYFPILIVYKKFYLLSLVMAFYIIKNNSLQGILFSSIIIGHLIFEIYFNVFVVIVLGSIALIISSVIRVSDGHVKSCETNVQKIRNLLKKINQIRIASTI